MVVRGGRAGSEITHGNPDEASRKILAGNILLVISFRSRRYPPTTPVNRCRWPHASSRIEQVEVQSQGEGTPCFTACLFVFFLLLLPFEIEPPRALGRWPPRLVLGVPGAGCGARFFMNNQNRSLSFALDTFGPARTSNGGNWPNSVDKKFGYSDSCKACATEEASNREHVWG